MKRCGFYEEQISAFLDGELGQDQKAELQAHMAVCRSCQKYFDDLVAIHEALMDADVDEVPVPEGFAEQVMARVRETPQDPAEAAPAKVIRFPHWRRWAAMAACCAVVLLGAWGFRSRNSGNVVMESQAWVTTAGAPQMARDAGIPAAADEGGVEFFMMDEDTDAQEEKGGLVRAADNAQNSISGDAPDGAAALDDAALMTEYSGAERENAGPVPSPAAAAPKKLAGTLTAGGDVVRQWVEDRLGLDWASGELYALTEEQYDELVAVLTEAGVEFRVEPGDACWLVAE